ncbi:MAG TPA: hypothetical protein VMA34_10445 [Terracidiphilus sp.]|nr:hypothetical protein [Terracidiphilus sp.]
MNSQTILEASDAELAAETVWNGTRAGAGPGNDLAPQALPVTTAFPEVASVEELQLVQRLFVLPGGEAPRVVVVCRADRGDGAELVCARTAEILAGQVKERVCLVDANLSDPALHCRYDLDGAAPSVDARQNGQTVNGAANHRRPRNLWILPGRVLRQRCSSLSPEWARAELQGLKEKFGFLVVCAPPLESAPDGFLWGRFSDGVLLVVDAHLTCREQVLKVRRSLEAYGVRLLGAVINEQPTNDTLDMAWEGARQALLKVQCLWKRYGMKPDRAA